MNSTWSSGLLGCVAAIAALGPAAAAQEPANKRKLGPEVNTAEYREILPIVAADGRTLYFVREDQGQDVAAQMNAQAQAAVAELAKALEGLDPETRRQMEGALKDTRQAAAQAPRANLGLEHQTIWYAERQPGGSWGAAKKMPPPLSHDVDTIWLGSVLPDNNTLLVGGSGVNGGLLGQWQQMAAAAARAPAADPLISLFSTSDGGQPVQVAGASASLFAWSQRTATGWSAPVPLRIRGFENDSPRLEIFLAPDGRHTFFSIRNRDSVGERDLYLAALGDDGVWGQPRNLGAPVNTPGVEMSPFMAPDGRSLYFASDRAGGLGGFDLYLTRRLDESWSRWSPPENLGPQVNTKGNDMNIAVDASGALAFMAIGPMMGEDIYEFALPPAVRPRPVAFVSGTVTDPSGKPLPAAIVYELLRDGTGAGHAVSRPADGRYQIALPIGADYSFRASASGYAGVADRLDLTAEKEAARIERNLVLVPLDVGQTIRLANVFFETGKATLLPASTRELDRVVGLLRDLPASRIEVRGHTDSVDDDGFNLTLSSDRAQAVVAYLAEAGIAAERLQAKGFGETAPVAPNTTPDGRQQNRRVEFVLLKK